MDEPPSNPVVNLGAAMAAASSPAMTQTHTMPTPSRFASTIPALVVASALGLAISACGGEDASQPSAASTTTEDAAPPSSATTEAPPATEAAKPTTTTARDPRGDTKAADLDIIEGSVSRATEVVRVTLRLTAAPTDDVIYSGMLVCGDELWQLGYKRAAGTTTIFAFDFGDGQQYEAEGDATGRTVSIAYSAADMGCTGALDVQLVAEGTNNRDPMSDYLPDPGPDTLNPKRLHLP